MERFSARGWLLPLAAGLAGLGCESADRNFGTNDAGAHAASPSSSTPDASANSSSTDSDDPPSGSAGGGPPGSTDGANAGDGGSGADGSISPSDGGSGSGFGFGGSNVAGNGGGNDGSVGASGSPGDGGENSTPSNGGSGEGGSGEGGASGANSSVAICGNGVLEPGEGCDEGAGNADSTSCNPSCQLDPCSDGEFRSCEDAGLLGNCAMGTQTCVAGVFGPCDVEPVGADSCVAGDDADCDGYPNENCGCMEGTKQSCAAVGAMGNCAMGEVTCNAQGMYGPCSVQPETLDSCVAMGDDADCDGNPSENCECENGDTQPCGPETEQGACTFGTSTCQNGAWGACVGAVYPASRDCRSSSDLDCNGQADNTIDGTCQCTPGTMEVCGAHPGQDGNGACRAGSRTCAAGANNTSSTWGACMGSVGPSGMADSCATVGNDANCDGTVNGGCTCISGQTTTCGAEYDYQGDCAAYSLTCSMNGTWPAAATACAAHAGDTCAPPGQCLSALWNDSSTPWGTGCWQ